MTRAAVAIPEKLFFKIGEVCELTGVQAHVLRYWESEFPMLAPQKNRAGQRTYRKRDVEMALRIKDLLYDDQYTIAGAKKKLAAEIRGSSKLKVVTPEMGSLQSSTSPSPQSAAQSQPPQPPPRTFLEDMSAGASRQTSRDEHLAAVRQLNGQLRELLSLLEKKEAPSRSRRR
jgi:DNA-binding transcriptional MerR regulator